MSFRYLILAGRGRKLDPALVDRVQERTRLQTAYQDGRLSVLTNGNDRVYRLRAEIGCVVGDLFHRYGPAAPIQAMSDLDQMDPMSDPAGTLVSRYWGGYMAAWNHGGAISILRDPSGFLPCFYMIRGDEVVVASDVALMTRAGLLKPMLDWGGIVRTLYADDLAQRRTGIAGVQQLRAGTVLIVGDRECSEALAWSPWSHAVIDPGIGSAEHVERLHRSVTLSTEAWARSFGRAVIAVSGGLDSSIVAACLLGKIDLECITLATAEPRGNETEYARALCAHLSLPLESFEYRLAEADIGRPAMPHLPRPGGRAQLLAFDAAVRAQIAHTGADCYITGSGGDNVFYLTHSARPLVDRFLQEGLTTGLFRTIADISAITGTSILEVARHALRVPSRRGPKYQWHFDGHFLHPDWLRELSHDPPEHPWLEAPSDALPGKAAHIAMLTRAQHYLDGYDRSLPFTAVAPLLSQPVVETALATPTWVMCERGIDRSVARRAFASQLPDRISRRQTKGGPDAFAIDILRTNLERARERLLDGHLAAQGIVSRPQLERALSNDKLSEPENYVRLLLMLDTEAWIDHWRDSETVFSEGGL